MICSTKSDDWGKLQLEGTLIIFIICLINLPESKSLSSFEFDPPRDLWEKKRAKNASSHLLGSSVFLS